MFETQFSILYYYVGPVPESCLPGVALMPCFKVVLTVALLCLLVFSWLFPISFASSALPLPSYWVAYHWFHGDLPFSLAYLSNLEPDFFLSCLGSFGCCFHSFLRLFVTPLFLIVVDQFWCTPILSHHWLSDVVAILISYQAAGPVPCDRYLSGLFCQRAKLCAGIKPTALCSAFDKENSIEFPLDSVYYLYMKSNHNPFFYPVLPYESLSSHASIDKKRNEKKMKRNIK